MSSHLSDQSIYAFHYDKRKSDESELQVHQEMPRDNNIRERRVGVVDLGHEVRVGDACPDFELDDTNGIKHRLSSYRGKRILLSFFR